MFPRVTLLTPWFPFSLGVVVRGGPTDKSCGVKEIELQSYRGGPVDILVKRDPREEGGRKEEIEGTVGKPRLTRREDLVLTFP